jgi:hypothetical protein
VRLDPDRHWLYVRSMGKALRVTAIYTSDTDANAYMATHPDQGCVAVLGPFILLANLYDQGIPIPKGSSHDHPPRSAQSSSSRYL